MCCDLGKIRRTTNEGVVEVVCVCNYVCVLLRFATFYFDFEFFDYDVSLNHSTSYIGNS